MVSPKCSNQQPQACLKEEDLDTSAVTLVEEALNMYNYIGKVIKESTRAGGHVSFLYFNNSLIDTCDCINFRRNK